MASDARLRFKNSGAGQVVGPATRALAFTGTVPTLAIGSTSFGITSVAGTLTHGSTVTINGAQFGTKSPPTPKIYDDCTAVDPSAAGWDGAWPNAIGGIYDIAYRTPAALGRGVALPHSNITKYLCGAHNGTAPDGGQNVFVQTNRVGSGFPFYTYANWWERADPSWVFSGDNYKLMSWNADNAPGYAGSNNWYAEIVGMTGAFDSGWHLNLDDFNTLDNPDRNGHNHYWDTGTCPMNGWKKVEVEAKWSPLTAVGYYKVWDNGVLRVDYAGCTDGTAAPWTSQTKRSEMIGGYSVHRSTNNFRYFADIYYDTVLQRVVLGNASTYGACTIREPQVCTSWAASQIQVTMKAGAFSSGQQRWFYVVNSTGLVTPGFAITMG